MSHCRQVPRNSNGGTASRLETVDGRQGSRRLGWKKRHQICIKATKIWERDIEPSVRIEDEQKVVLGPGGSHGSPLTWSCLFGATCASKSNFFRVRARFRLSKVQSICWYQSWTWSRTQKSYPRVTREPCVATEKPPRWQISCCGTLATYTIRVLWCSIRPQEMTCLGHCTSGTLA